MTCPNHKHLKSVLSEIIIIIIIIIFFFFLIYSCLLVIRLQSSGKSRSQQEIKAIYPNTLQIRCAVLMQSFLVLWLTRGLWAPEGSDLIPS